MIIFIKNHTRRAFLACRFGNTELQTVVGYLKIKYKGHNAEDDAYLDKWFNKLGQLSGFFPVDYQYLKPFSELILSSGANADLLAMWHLNMEDFVIENLHQT